MLTSFAGWVMRGRFLPFASIFFLASMPFMLWLASGLVALVTLRRGAFEGACALLAAILPVAGLVIYGGSLQEMAGEYQLAQFEIMRDLQFRNDLIALLAAFGAANFLRVSVKLSWTLLLVSVMVCAALVTGLVPVDQWVELFRTHLGQITSQMPEVYQEELANLEADKSAMMLPYLVGQYLSFILMSNVLLPLMLGRWWQASLYNPGGFGKEFYTLAYSSFAATVMFASVLLVDHFNPFPGIGWVLLVPLVMVGTAIVHVAIKHKQASKVWLIMYYLFLPVTYSMVAVLAWCDSLWNIRARIVRSE